MNWYYTSNNTQKGPISADLLKEKIASGEVKPSDLVWRDGMGDWTPASRVAEFSTATTSYSAPAYDTPPPISQTNNPYHAPASGVSYPSPTIPAYGQEKKLGLSIASMVTGICSIASCCIPYLSIFVAIAAVITGHIAHSKIKHSPQQYGGRGMKTTGLITGYIGLVLAIVYLIFIGSVMTNPDKLRNFQDSLKEFEARQSQRSAP